MRDIRLVRLRSSYQQGYVPLSGDTIRHHTGTYRVMNRRLRDFVPVQTLDFVWRRHLC